MSEKDPNEPVRVKDVDTGHTSTIRRMSLPHGNYEELEDVDAVDPLTGAFLPPEYGEPAQVETSGRYVGLTKDDLQREIDERNAGRDESALIQVSAPGNKPDLISALEADDENQES